MKAIKMKLIVLAASISFALAAPLASAVDVGLGVSLNNDGEGSGGYGVSLPLRFGTITVEPELSFYNSSQDRAYPLSPTNNYTTDYQQFTLETGIYWRQQVVPSVETYVGGRVGYTHYDYSYTYPSSPGSNYSNEYSGFYLGPTFGAEYFFNKHFSLGLDVSLLYESTSGDYINGGSTSESDRTQLNYQTRSRLRFYF